MTTLKGRKFLTVIFLLLAAVLPAQANSAAGRGGETVIIGDEMNASGGAWLPLFAQEAAGESSEIINALRPGWKSSDVWYVREILGQYPRAAAYVILASTNDLRTIDSVDPEAVARIGARAGYMADIIREVNPAAAVLLVAPPQVDPAKHTGYPASALVLSEMLAANLEKTAASRGLHFLSLLDRFSPAATADSIYPKAAEEQKKLARLLAAELRYPLAQQSAPLCATAGAVPPPAAGRPVADGQGAEMLASSIMADLAALPAAPAGAPAAVATAPASIRSYVCTRDLAQVICEEGVSLAAGALDGLRELIGSELAEQEELRMNEMFNFPGAETYAEVTREAPINEALISAIVPPAAAEGFAGAVVDWDTVPAPDNPGFNAVTLAPRKKAPQAVNIADFSDDPDDIDIPGMTEFDADPVLAAAKTAIPVADVIREPVVVRGVPAPAAEQDLTNAPWNKPETAATAVAQSVSAAINYPLPDAEGGIDDTPAVKIEKVLNGENILAAAAEAEDLGRFINKESTMQPLTAAAQAPAVPGYAVYVHTGIE